MSTTETISFAVELAAPDSPNEAELAAADGSRLTDDRAAALAERALARRRGRPSVTGEEAHTRA